MSEQKIVVLDGARTPVGSYGGVLSSVEAYQLGGHAIAEALSRTGVDGNNIGDVIMGQVGQVGPDAYNARRTVMEAGLPESTPAFNVNRLCGSGLQAVWSAAQELHWGGADYVVAGGNESMSRMPFLDFNARGNKRLGHRTVLDGTIAMLTDPFSNAHMGVTAENVAAKYSVSRVDQDEFAAESQRRAASAEAQAAFAEEIIALEVNRVGTIDTDEHPKPDSTVEKLAGLRAAFQKDGTVTAGNASGINDGGAAMVLSTAEVAAAQGHSVLGSLEHVTKAAMDPNLMGYAPTHALNTMWDETGLSPADIGHVELNEAFASQSLAVIRDSGLSMEQTNPYGGAIALGHPIGATGAVLTLRALYAMRRNNHEYVIVTACIGGGQALALLFKNAA